MHHRSTTEQVTLAKIWLELHKDQLRRLNIDQIRRRMRNPRHLGSPELKVCEALIRQTLRELGVECARRKRDCGRRR